MRLEGVRLLEMMLSEYLVIIYFTIDCQRYCSIFTEERLCSGVDSDNAKTLVDEDGIVGEMVAAPVWATVSYRLAHTQGSRFELPYIWVTWRS